MKYKNRAPHLKCFEKNTQYRSPNFKKINIEPIERLCVTIRKNKFKHKNTHATNYYLQLLRYDSFVLICVKENFFRR